MNEGYVSMNENAIEVLTRAFGPALDEDGELKAWLDSIGIANAMAIEAEGLELGSDCFALLWAVFSRGFERGCYITGKAVEHDPDGASLSLISNLVRAARTMRLSRERLMASGTLAKAAKAESYALAELFYLEDAYPSFSECFAEWRAECEKIASPTACSVYESPEEAWWDVGRFWDESEYGPEWREITGEYRF